MATARIFQNKDILNGAAVICPVAGSGSNYIYDAGCQRIPSGESILILQILDGRYLRDEWEGQAPPQTASDIRTPTSGQAAGVHYGADAYRRHKIQHIDWSYDTTPVSGYVQVESPSGTVIWGPQYITSAGAGFHDFNEDELSGAMGNSMFVVLANGGPNCRGSLSIVGHRLI